MKLFGVSSDDGYYTGLVTTTENDLHPDFSILYGYYTQSIFSSVSRRSLVAHSSIDKR